jgi:Ca-activated chloride channel family protein
MNTPSFAFAAAVVVWITVACSAVASGGKQNGDTQAEESVELGTALVTVPFNVADKKNRPVVDIKRDEIQVFEEGKQQEVFSFERLADASLTIALLVDTSGSMEAVIGEERVAANRFFQKVLRPEKDLASVLTFAKEVTLEQPLTANVGALNSALNRARVPLSGSARSSAGGTSLYDAVYLAAEELRGEAGRRVTILLTDGVDTTSAYTIKDAIERAWRSDVMIYAIGMGDFSYGGIDLRVLEKLTRETGGRFFEPRGIEDLDRAFDEIQSDLRQQYVLSYSPANATHDGRFRTIEVKLAGAGRKDHRVRHRRGYYGPDPQDKR